MFMSIERFYEKAPISQKVEVIQMFIERKMPKFQVVIHGSSTLSTVLFSVILTIGSQLQFENIK
jgi:hypothetical protein